MQKFIIILIIALVHCQDVIVAQEYNKFDENAQRHGSWQKKYAASMQLRYEGIFDHGKEIGLFKFYDIKGGHPTAIKEYTSGSDAIDVNFFTTKGKKVSEGKMIGRKREGSWTSYHQDGTSIMIKETYTDGVLTGDRIVYFLSGNEAQREQYINGLKEGDAYYYSDEGKILKKLTYKNDLLEGVAKFYNGFGQIEADGFYKKNRKHGIWKYYKNGKVDKEITFPQNKIGVH